MTPARETLRSPDDLIAAGLAPPERLAELERVAARYAVAITPAVADADRSAPIRTIRSRASSCPMRPSSTTTPEERADPIGDDAHSPVEGIVHRYPDRVLLKLVHVCAVYCRFCFRREMVGPRRRGTLSRRALDAALAYIARASGDLGGDPHRRRSAGALAAPARARSCARLAAIEHVKIVRLHTRVPVVEPGSGSRRRWSRALQGARQGDLRGAARQPSARADARGARRLRAARRCRHPDAQPDRAAARRQRRSRRRSAR